MPDFLLIFAIVAVVLTVTALASGLVERSLLSFPLLFLGFGFLIGRHGLGIIEIEPHDPTLEVIATLTLALVLFLDAVKLQVDELGRRWLIPFLVLGPGTALIIVLGAVPIALLVGFGWIMAFIGGAILASTDPVVLREILRDSRIPRSVRQILKIEAGMNDIVVLPVILILIAVAQAEVGSVGGWASLLGKLLLVGPAIGFAIGGAGAWLMARISSRTSVRLEYQALYGIGLVLASYTASTFAGGDGFLGAFAAGLAVVLLNQTLCECFLDYGEVTAEMAMMLAFVLFGVVLSSILDLAPVWQTLLLAAIVIFAIRPSVLSLVLARARISHEARAFIDWFGPRGLNSLLLALLVVQANIPGAELLLATVGVVVIVSVTIHGASATPASAWYGRKVASRTLAEERENTAAGLLAGGDEEIPRISPRELDELLSGPNPPLVLDVRSRSTYERDGAQIPGSVRVLPDSIVEWAAGQPMDRFIVAYCT
ncbi:MAG: cation:proton antiporter [Chloroflexi bacterium]|nr:cation:proton antiporter [Chloroflexota bacterium]